MSESDIYRRQIRRKIRSPQSVRAICSGDQTPNYGWINLGSFAMFTRKKVNFVIYNSLWLVNHDFPSIGNVCPKSHYFSYNMCLMKDVEY